jgi:hypothetical protein
VRSKTKSNRVPTAIREQGLPGKFAQLVLKGNKPGRVTSESESISRNERLWNGRLLINLREAARGGHLLWHRCRQNGQKADVLLINPQ